MGWNQNHDHFRSENLAAWDDRVAGHLALDGYGADVERLVAEPDFLSAVVAFDHAALSEAGLGDLTGKTLLHSQCHIGTDSVSWGKLGATVTGIDFAPQAIDAATAIADRIGLDATFLLTEFYDAPAAVENHFGPNHQFDIVYTSVGAICWLPDIDAWGQILASFVKPGGTFYIRDSHPALMALDDERDDDELVVKFPYFNQAEPMTFTNEKSYSGSAIRKHPTSHEWSHSVSSVINSLINAGLAIDKVDELRHLDFKFFDHMVPDGERQDHLVLPDHQRDLVPMQFSVLAHKPAE